MAMSMPIASRGCGAGSAGGAAAGIDKGRASAGSRGACRTAALQRRRLFGRQGLKQRLVESLKILSNLGATGRSGGGGGGTGGRAAGATDGAAAARHLCAQRRHQVRKQAAAATHTGCAGSQATGRGRGG